VCRPVSKKKQVDHWGVKPHYLTLVLLVAFDRRGDWSNFTSKIAILPICHHPSDVVQLSTEDMEILATKPPNLDMYIEAWFRSLFILFYFISYRSRNCMLPKASNQTLCGRALIQFKFIRCMVGSFITFLIFYCRLFFTIKTQIV
jgi:hypothetical protein